MTTKTKNQIPHRFLSSFRKKYFRPSVVYVQFYSCYFTRKFCLNNNLFTHIELVYINIRDKRDHFLLPIQISKLKWLNAIDGKKKKTTYYSKNKIFVIRLYFKLTQLLKEFHQIILTLSRIKK